MALEKHDVCRDIRERVLTEGCKRQADSAKQVGLPRDMLTRRGVGGIQKETADHKCRDAAFPQQTDGLGQKIVVDGEFSQFGKIGIVQRLLAEGGLPITASRPSKRIWLFWKPILRCCAWG